MDPRTDSQGHEIDEHEDGTVNVTINAQAIDLGLQTQDDGAD